MNDLNAESLAKILRETFPPQNDYGPRITWMAYAGGGADVWNHD